MSRYCTRILAMSMIAAAAVAETSASGGNGAAPVAVAPAADPNIDTTELSRLEEFKFRFKKDKIGNQRPEFKVKLRVPTVQGVANILMKRDDETDPAKSGKKAYELLMESLTSTIRSAMASLIGNDPAIDQSNAEEKLQALSDWFAIANMPKADRRAAIDEEIWNTFVADYIEIMPALSNKSVDNVTAATQVYLKKFSMFKTDKVTLNNLKNQLALYVANTKKGEEVSEVLELLSDKLDAYLKADDVEQLRAALG